MHLAARRQLWVFHLLTLLFAILCSGSHTSASSAPGVSSQPPTHQPPGRDDDDNHHIRFASEAFFEDGKSVFESTDGIVADQHQQRLDPQTAKMSAIRRTAPLVFPAPKKHTATVIFAHGLGDTGAGWASAVENWRRRQRLDQVKFVLPNAPVIPITANWGAPMPGWFDILSRQRDDTRINRPVFPQKAIDGSIESLRANEDEAGVRATAAYLHELIQAEVDAGIPSERIVLGGFSQGGAMSLFAGLTAPRKIGGVVGLSCWLVLSGKFGDELKKEGVRGVNADTKVWMGHGSGDQVVRFELGKMSAEGLRELGFDVSFNVYPGMPHSACLEELDEVENFLGQQLPQVQE